MVNLLLFSAKVTLSVFFDSVALLADALNSLTDAMGGVFSAAAFILSARAPSARFPDGFSRAAPLGAFAAAVWLCASGVFALLESVGEFFVGEDARSSPSVWLFLLFAACKAALAAWLFVCAKKTQSSVLMLCAKDSAADALLGLFASASPVFYALGFAESDALFGAALSLVLIGFGFGTARENLPYLIGDRSDFSLEL
ncbi:MAG: cation diffusion facilitator family transporter [Clostridia bacterium]|nr:cation diffusion facilitator family transporter [Clostridia bacterium]